MKRITLFLFALFFVRVNGYCLIGEILSLVKWGAEEANRITTEIFQKNMLAQTMESVATLKRNYEDSMRHYEDLKRIYTDPYGVTQEFVDSFKESLDNPVDRFFSEIDQRAYNKKGFIQKKLDSGLEYVKTNWEFADKVKEKIKDRDEELKIGKIDKKTGVKKKPIIEKLASKDKAEVEDGKIQLELLKSEQFAAIERSLLKLIEIQNVLLERQVWYEEFAKDMQDKYFSFAQELEKAKQRQLSRTVSREQKIKQYIEEIPKYERPKK
ncbi:MAG: hypothetical protein QME68_00140 [Elusimicrobiota bacterium]|nr:hypothetical protein [Elusimicrobiota bacterium]